jgi:hypothetical protein
MSLFRSKRQARRSRRQLVESLEARNLLAADPIITEFMADNRDTYFDEDGAAPDWVEIHNRGDESIDLAGWYLTDNAATLTAWQFPSTNLEPGQYAIVFASGNDREGTGPNGEHHANFTLQQNGEYLALVMPDGLTVTSQYSSDGSEYPSQREGVSYGIVNQTLEVTVLVEEGDVAHTLIPDAADATNFANTWRGGDEVSFDAAGGAASWIEGATSVGFGTGALITAGLVQDLDADNGVATNGSTVTTWSNQVGGSGDDVVTNRGTPELVTGPNGHNAVRFVSDDRLAGDDHPVFDSLMNGSGYTWFVVSQPVNQNAVTKNQMIGTLREGTPGSESRSPRRLVTST